MMNFLPENSAASRVRPLGPFLARAAQDLRGSSRMALALFRRQHIQRFRFSWLGSSWAILPALTVWAWMVLSSQSNSNSFFAVFGMTAMHSWIEAFQLHRNLFIQHQFVLKRDNIKLEGLMLATLLELGLTSLTRLLLILGAMLYFSVEPGPNIAFFPIGFGGFVLLGAAAGLAFAPFQSLKRDVEHLLTLVPWVLIGLTPVFSPLGQQSNWGHIMQLNPLSWVLESMRSLAYPGSVTIWIALGCFPLGLLLWLLGWLSCRFWRPYVIERMLA